MTPTIFASDLTISNLALPSFDHFAVYLNDQLADNGVGGLPYFQPVARAGSSITPEWGRRFRAALLLPLGMPGWRRAWVARNQAGDIVGHIDLRAHADAGTEHRCQLGMGVRRDYRRVGLGRRLIAHAEQWAMEQIGLDWIDLQALSDNHAAIRLYVAAGFAHCGLIEDMYRLDGHRLDYSSMCKRLVR